MPLPDEFGLISKYFKPLAADFPGALGLTDDAALIAHKPGNQIVVTADALVAGIHFFPGDPADLIIKKAIRTNLSDLAAMGAEPVAILSCLCLPKETSVEWMELFAKGIKSDLAEFGIALIGGDLVATDGPLTIAITAFGEIKEKSAILRSNARSGDIIWVSGTLGDSAFGLLAIEGESEGIDEEDRNFLMDRYHLPQPRTILGNALVGIAHAMMDISDGLIGDVAHICNASGLGAEIDAGLLPLSKAARQAVKAGWGKGVETVLTGGDDYELLFTAPLSSSANIYDLGIKIGLRLTQVGRMGDNKGVRILQNGESFAIEGGGHRHF